MIGFLQDSCSLAGVGAYTPGVPAWPDIPRLQNARINSVGLRLNLPCSGRIIPADGIHVRRETSMSGLFEQGMWLEAYRVLASGEPPILFQLLMFNTIMMVFWHMR